jgi:hypothetical protein
MKRKKLKSKEAQKLFEKGQEIFELIGHIVDIIPEEQEMQVHMGRQMYDNAMCILPKIYGAEGGKLYEIKMECAALIRYYAKDVIAATTMLEAFEYEYSEYLTLVKKNMDEFKLLFKKWVATFDPKLALEDEWGLFNPPGINLDEINPDEIFDNLSEDEEDEEDWWKNNDED